MMRSEQSHQELARLIRACLEELQSFPGQVELIPRQTGRNPPISRGLIREVRENYSLTSPRNKTALIYWRGTSS